MTFGSHRQVAVVTGAGGQDGYFLTQLLLKDGWRVHATSRQNSIPGFDYLPADLKAQLSVHQIDLLRPEPMFDLIQRIQPDEFYHLAGQSSVAISFSDPLYTWQTNTEAVVNLLECIRKNSPHTRFYQASSTDMFGMPPSDKTVLNEDSALNPQSPYASAKAAAHLLCHSYREVFGLRVAIGILSNHESHRRPASFLSRKVVEHVIGLKGLSIRQLANASPLAVGNLKVQRDWGFACDYIDGMLRIMRQIKTRGELTGGPIAADEGSNYRDYVLATGEIHAVWELIDSAFRIGGFELEWNIENDDPAVWRADFRSSRTPAVVVNPDLLRAADPLVIRVDPGRARKELGWAPRQGLDVFLRDMMTLH
ncbi:MAG: GDPmannose 4,6-dehydratase [Blastocatellia bacterium]|jgi:GDPmannose 4,6-dehydratase|nr:GDPmannose 4,6-dehydratase [Blastocatellia bacterium]